MCKKRMKKILVYPCGTEIGLEIYKGLCYSKEYELWGGSSSYDHGRFVFKKHIDGLPFITDSSGEDEILQFISRIEEYRFDFIYPAMDGVLTVFSRYRKLFLSVIIAPDYETNVYTRSKAKTYELLRDVIPTPDVYHDKAEIPGYPVFVKPDCGQGAVGARLIRNEEAACDIDWGKEICMEYLDEEEYTVDCFTNQDGKAL